MKAYIKYKYLVVIILFFVLSSCEKWLDVAPKTQIEADLVFEKETGFQDALTGVYVNMTSESLYGRELTFGFVDGLAGQYNGLGTANEYYSTINYDYDEVNFISKSETLFEKSYNVIANINTLIAKLDEKGEGMFSGVNYHIIRGEAYGLRAFLHFDLIRLYGSSIASQGETALALPYIDAIGTQPKERLTTQVFLEHVLSDLEIAAQALQNYDPIVPANANNSSVYLRDRTFKFNYYAVKALEARAHLYAGDKIKALAAAREVIESDVFDWTPSSEIATFDVNSRNKVFTQELIFSLHINGLGTITSPFYDIGVSGNLLAKSPFQYDALFSNQVDYRYQYLTEFAPSVYRHFSNKFVQNASNYAAFSNRMPLIRKSELYYIAAECLADVDTETAIQYLNQVRQHRNIEDLASSLTSTQLQEEIKLEYRKEFIGEGQIFYYYKRHNATQIDDVFVTMDEKTYVLPLPDREIFYGQ